MAEAQGLSTRTLYNVFSKLLSALTFLLLNAVSTRILDAETYGETQYIIWFAYTVWTIANFAIPTVISRYIALGSSKNLLKFLRQPLFYLLFTLILISVAIAVWYLFQDHFIIVFLLCVSIGCFFFVQSIFEGSFQNKQHFIATVISSIITLIVLYPLVLSFGFSGYLISVNVMLFGYSIMGSVLIFFDKKNFPLTTSSVSNKEIINFALYTWLAAVISIFVWQRLEIYFLDKYLTAVDVAYFSLGVNIANIVAQPIVLLSSALTPYFSLKHFENNSDQTQYVYFFLTKLFAWVGYFVGWFVCFNSEWIVVTLFGEQYRSASTIVAILSASAPIAAVASVGSSMLYGYGRSGFIAASSFVGAVLSIIAFTYITPNFGLIGVGYTRILLQVIMIATGTVYIAWILKIHVPFKEYMVSVIIAGLVNYAVFLFIKTDSIIELFIFVVISLFLYLFISFSMRYFTHEEKIQIKKVLTDQLSFFSGKNV